jgi:sugar phosphate isomerase/epimerase
MAAFPEAYYTAMDRGYYMPLQEGQGTPDGSPGTSDAAYIPDIGIRQQDIGVSTHPGQDQLQQVKARIFQGASKIELGFFGRDKGSLQQGNTTPGMYGKEERIDIRELAKVNKLKVTTHATTASQSLAGFSQRGFDEHQREKNLHEIERAVDFAADVSSGGAIVVHAQEFERPILDAWGQEKFEAYPEEKEKAIRYLVDDRTGQVQPIRKNEIFFEPVFKEDKNGNWVDIQGNPIPKDTDDVNLLFERVPLFDEEAIKKGIPSYATRKVTWDEIVERSEERKKSGQDISPEKLFYQIQLHNNILQSKGMSLFYGTQTLSYEKEREKLIEAYEFYKGLDESLPENEKWKMLQQVQGRILFLPPEVVNPKDYLQEQIQQHEMQLRQMKQSSSTYDVQAAQQAETLKQMKPIKEYALEKTADTIARAALYARDKEKHLRQDVREGDALEKPLFVAIENFFPEVYGGHPDEVVEIVEKSREALVDEMVRKPDKYGHVTREEAKGIANEKIKATWDTGHAFIWKKYFEGSDDEFKTWYLEKAKKWIDKGIMGHAHVSDNFGYEDEHVIPGQGIAPIKEFISLIKERVDKGEVDVIVEPAHQDYRALLGGWRLFGSSIYGSAFGKKDNWADVERSYFGRTAPPYFLYGETAPDPESWTLWSGQRLE